MANYFIKLTRVFPPGEEPLFVGPFDREKDADFEINKAINEVEYEITKGDKPPKFAERAILAEVLTQTAARRGGLKSKSLGDKRDTLIGEKIPLDPKVLGLPEGNGKLPSSILAEGEIEEEIIENESQPLPKKVFEDDFIDGYERNNVLIVTQYYENTPWLHEQGIFGEVNARPRDDEIRGRTVIGNIPYRLAHLAKRVGAIEMPGIRADQKGQRLTPKELYEVGAYLRWFRVVEEKNEWLEFFRYVDKYGMKDIIKYIREKK